MGNFPSVLLHIAILRRQTVLNTKRIDGAYVRYDLSEFGYEVLVFRVRLALPRRIPDDAARRCQVTDLLARAESRVRVYWRGLS